MLKKNLAPPLIINIVAPCAQRFRKHLGTKINMSFKYQKYIYAKQEKRKALFNSEPLSILRGLQQILHKIRLKITQINSCVFSAFLAFFQSTSHPILKCLSEAFEPK